MWFGSADIIILLAELTLVISYLFRDMLYLRIITIFGQAGFLVAGFAADLNTQSMKALIFTTGAAILINVYQIFIILKDRTMIELPHDAREMYRQSFFLLTPVQFLKDIYNYGKYVDYPPHSEIIHKDKEVESLILIRKGKVSIAKADGTHADMIPGFFIGEMSLITGHPATATVSTSEESVKCFVWNKQILKNLEDNKPEIYLKLQQVLALNLIKKLTQK